MHIMGGGGREGALNPYYGTYVPWHSTKLGPPNERECENWVSGTNIGHPGTCFG